MFFSTSAAFAALFATASAKAGRTFAVNRFYGTGPLVTSRMDPIVNPGVASSHLHTIQGGNAFAMTLSDSQLLTSTCTSSLIKDDLSAYWTPSLFFQDPTTNKFEPVEMFYMNVYYFFEGTDDQIQAFPEGLRMVVGNPSLRTPPSTGGGSIVVLDDSHPTAQPIQWTCPRSNYDIPSYPANSDGLHGYGIQDPNNKGAGVGFPDQECDGYASPLRADIHFPSCYNPAAGLHDYKNNMAWPTSVNGKQNCPAGYIHVPHIFYEVYWNTPKFSGRWTPGQGKQPFVLSNGDKTGYSLHGDFLAGWKTATLQQIIDNCDAGDAGMDQCPGLIGGVNDRSTSCTIPSPINEATTGILDLLPGGISATGFGAAVVAAAAGSSAPAPAATTTSAPPAAVASSTKPAAAATTSKASNGGSPGSGSGYGGSSKPVTTTAAAPASAPKHTTAAKNPATCGWRSIGCWSDIRDKRVLSGAQFVAIGNHQVTATACMSACDTKGFTMAGVEFGGQCFCGNTLANTGSTKIDDSLCFMPCEGDSSQICGGALALNVYSKSNSMRLRYAA